MKRKNELKLIKEHEYYQKYIHAKTGSVCTIYNKKALRILPWNHPKKFRKTHDKALVATQSMDDFN